MDALDDVSGTQRLQFALANRTAAHIAGRNCALLAQKDGASGERRLVLRVPDLQARDESKSSRHTRSIAKSKGPQNTERTSLQAKYHRIRNANSYVYPP